VTDSTTKLDISFAFDQEAARKDVARGFGALKLKYQALVTLSLFITMKTFIM
jgi:hypothetical protein